MTAADARRLIGTQGGETKVLQGCFATAMDADNQGDCFTQSDEPNDPFPATAPPSRRSTPS